MRALLIGLLLAAAALAQAPAPVRASATESVATASVPPTLIDALTSGIKVNITGTLPGEAVIVALLEYAKEVRGSMDVALQKRLDAVLVQQIEDLQAFWRSIWITLGVVHP